MQRIDYFKAQALVEQGAKVWHVFAPEGTCYCLAKEMPAVDNAYFVAKIPEKFAKNPVLYRHEDYFRGSFWWEA